MQVMVVVDLEFVYSPSRSSFKYNQTLKLTSIYTSLHTHQTMTSTPSQRSSTPLHRSLALCFPRIISSSILKLAVRVLLLVVSSYHRYVRTAVRSLVRREMLTKKSILLIIIRCPDGGLLGMLVRRSSWTLARCGGVPRGVSSWVLRYLGWNMSGELWWRDD
ncbi:hypothetical protein IQ07DRAFT_100015 [Pyrenochaeta sp. DS3sAY3a]|nr:hypothetical protein IQ07DRAFT_100015 [Pyrenochaeta sp. DS3sAY3a]